MPRIVEILAYVALAVMIYYAVPLLVAMLQPTKVEAFSIPSTATRLRGKLTRLFNRQYRIKKLQLNEWLDDVLV